jgi:hypothetical protein
MSALTPVPAVPIRDDAQQDAIWKRWLSQLQINQGSLGGFAAGSVIFANGAGALTTDANFTYNSSTDVLTVNGSTFGQDVSVAGNLTAANLISTAQIAARVSLRI